VGYGVHNLFVFDNLYSYVYFFAILALIDSQVGRPIKRLEEVDEMSENNGLTYALPVAAVVLCAVVWFVNVPGMRVATSLITALSPAQAGIGANIATFQDVAARPAFAAQEVREQLVSFGASVIQSSQATETEKQQAFTLAVTEMQSRCHVPLDTREHLQLPYIYCLGVLVSRAALSSRLRSGRYGFRRAYSSRVMLKARTAFTTAYSLNPRVKSLAEYAAAGNIAREIRSADSVLLEAYGDC
jgi:hypothetical protein